MGHMFLELLIWSLIAFFIGCLIGCLLKKMFAAEEAAPVMAAPVAPRAPAPPPPPAPAVKAPEPAPVVAPPIPAMPKVEPVPLKAPEAEPVALASEPMGRPERPKGIAKPRGGKADNLQRISGVGPKNERVLHNLGFFHFDQIAEWTREQVKWVDDHLKFNGRIAREEWIKQARLLADGKEEEFLRLYGTGGLRNRQGETKSGERTRKS